MPRKPRMVLVWEKSRAEIIPDTPLPVWWDEALDAAFDAFYAVVDRHERPFREGEEEKGRKGGREGKGRERKS